MSLIHVVRCLKGVINKYANSNTNREKHGVITFFVLANGFLEYFYSDTNINHEFEVFNNMMNGLLEIEQFIQKNKVEKVRNFSIPM